jgi:AraC-like DNA-binding protein
MAERDEGSTLLEEPGIGSRIEAAVEYLKERLFDAGLAPSIVARHAGLDPWSFCRRFKAVTGITCGEFITRERMREAMRLLARRDLLVKQVAHRVGFEDANYFSRRFKRAVGMSPTSFRKRGSGPDTTD